MQTRPLLPLCAFGFGQTLGQTGVPDVSAGASTLAKLAWQEAADGCQALDAVYANGEIRPILQSTPAIDRTATGALVRRLYPAHRIAEIADDSYVSSSVWATFICIISGVS